jgi:hypothetical protein
MLSLTPNTTSNINSLSINDSTKDTLYFTPIDIETASTISGSMISWDYPVISGFDFNADVQIYALVTGGNQWDICTNGSGIPQITANMETAGKKLYIKAVMPKLAVDATIDPALFTMNIIIY